MSWWDQFQNPAMQAGLSGAAAGFGRGAQGGYGTLADALTYALMGFDQSQAQFAEEQRRREEAEARRKEHEEDRAYQLELRANAQRAQEADATLADWMQARRNVPGAALAEPPSSAFATGSDRLKFEREFSQERESEAEQQRLREILGPEYTGIPSLDREAYKLKIKPEKPAELTPYQRESLSLQRSNAEESRAARAAAAERDAAAREESQRRWVTEQELRGLSKDEPDYLAAFLGGGNDPAIPLKRETPQDILRRHGYLPSDDSGADVHGGSGTATGETIKNPKVASVDRVVQAIYRAAPSLPADAKDALKADIAAALAAGKRPSEITREFIEELKHRGGFR